MQVTHESYMYDLQYADFFHVCSKQITKTKFTISKYFLKKMLYIIGI